MQIMKRSAAEQGKPYRRQAASASSDERQTLVALLTGTARPLEWAEIDTFVQRQDSEAIPALLAGLAHPNGKIRAACALLLDHVAADRCVEPLLRAVRRCALHSLICDGCKECPLNTDVISALLEVAMTHRSVAVRRRAVFYLSMQRPDARVTPFLHNLLATEQDAILRRRAQNALKQHPPLPTV